MKQSVLLSMGCLCAFLNLTAQDTPNPPANLQTLPAGSYVIAMDNTHQANTDGVFNLKTYGLVVYLLNNNIKVKWVIKAGKVKDATDFTAMSEQVKPVPNPANVARDFKAAPFVIFKADTTGVSSLIHSYYSSQGLTGNDRPRVYRTTADIPNVDIRYNMTGFIPKAAILTDGGNQRIHRDYMIAAGITTTNFSEVGAVTLSDCYTFASEPHNDESGPALDAIVASIKNFVMSGRNFLAECAAVRTYENNAYGKFHTSTGITDANEKIGTNVAFPYADLSYYQIDGSFDASAGGSLQNWTLPSGVSNPATYVNATGNGIYAPVQAATVSKLVSGQGGLVFYLGNHEFKTNNPEEINGIRLYLNAFLTPANPAVYCGAIVLSVKLTAFTGSLTNNKSKLQWTVAQNEAVNKFEVERSEDGTRFTMAGLVFGSEKSGTENYPYTETTFAEKVYYRLKMTDKNGTVTYSSILVLQNNAVKENTIRIINNPVNDQLTLSLQSTSNLGITITVTDMAGRRVMQQQMNSYKGNNLVSMPLPAGMNQGMYIVDVMEGAERRSLKFIKN